MNLIGFIEFRSQSQPLFTNWLANSEMNLATNFRTSQRSSECYIESYLKPTITNSQRNIYIFFEKDKGNGIVLTACLYEND